MLSTWLRQAASILDTAYATLPRSPISIRVTFAEIVGVTQGRISPKNVDELRSLIHVIACSGEADIRIDIEKGFDDGLLQPDNIAERTLVEALVNGVATAAGEEDNVEKSGSVVTAICPNSQMRYMHRFEAQTFRDFLRSEIGRKPLLVNEFDHAACLLGLGWRDRPRELGPEITGVLGCTSYLNKIVEILIKDICDILQKLDRRSVIKALLFNHEAAASDWDTWRRTAQASLAFHKDKSAALATIVEHDGRLGVCFTLTRILIEAAICECPLAGRRTPGKLDLSRLMSLAFLVFSFGGDSDAVHWGAMEPRIRVTPLGDIHMKRSFQTEIYDPFARAGTAAQVEHAAEQYAGLYGPRPVIESVADLLSERYLRAWEAEFGISIDGIRAFIEQLEHEAVTRKEPLVTIRRSALVAALANAANCPAEQASGTLTLFTLESRTRWPVAPNGFKNPTGSRGGFVDSCLFFDVRSSRSRLAMILKIILGPGLVHEAILLTARWFHEGSIHQSETRSAEMESWIGHVNNENGNEFTREVEAKLNQLGWKTESEIALTNVLARRRDARFGDLKRFGDIDVLAWRDGSSRILAIECKDVQFSKTPGEVAEQLSDFRGELRPNGKPDLLKRHLDRIEVLTANTGAVAKRLKLSTPICVEGHLVFRNPVPMGYAWEHMASRIRLSILAELDRL